MTIYRVNSYTLTGKSETIATCETLHHAQVVLAGLAAAAIEFESGLDIQSGPRTWTARRFDGALLEHFWIEEVGSQAIQWPELNLPPINLWSAPVQGRIAP